MPLLRGGNKGGRHSNGTLKLLYAKSDNDGEGVKDAKRAEVRTCMRFSVNWRRGDMEVFCKLRRYLSTEFLMLIYRGSIAHLSAIPPPFFSALPDPFHCQHVGL